MKAQILLVLIKTKGNFYARDTLSKETVQRCLHYFHFRYFDVRMLINYEKKAHEIIAKIEQSVSNHGIAKVLNIVTK